MGTYLLGWLKYQKQYKKKKNPSYNWLIVKPTGTVIALLECVLLQYVGDFPQPKIGTSETPGDKSF